MKVSVYKKEIELSLDCQVVLMEMNVCILDYEELGKGEQQSIKIRRLPWKPYTMY